MGSDLVGDFEAEIEKARRNLENLGDGDGGAGTGDDGTGGGDAGDIEVGTVSFDELDTDPGQDGIRKTIRNLDQGAIDFIRGVTGASSDAEVVRKAVVLAEHMLVQG